jgi:hypothetical protein
LGAEIANAIKALDSRVAALEAGGGSNPVPPDPIPPTDNAGLITEFNATPGSGGGKRDGVSFFNQTTKSYSIQNPDPYTLRFEVHKGDYIWGGGSIDQAHMQETKKLPPNCIVDYRYKFMVEANSGNNFVNRADWSVWGEWHNDDSVHGGSGTSPPVAIELAGANKNQIWVVARYRPPNGNFGSDIKTMVLWKDPNPIPVGQYVDIQLKFKLANDASGYLTAIINGQQVADYHGMLGYGEPIYLMAGIYRAGGPTENLMANFKNITVS